MKTKKEGVKHMREECLNEIHKRGLKKTFVAEKIGCSLTTLSKWLNNREGRELKPIELERLRELLSF